MDGETFSPYLKRSNEGQCAPEIILLTDLSGK
jgi:hypothetical protein